MYKVVDPAAQDHYGPIVQLVKMSSRGLTGLDKVAFEKRAAASIVHKMDDVRGMLKEGEYLVHMLAIGSTEDYGPNRNGDGFRREVCKKYHPTFKKHARMYRNHANKDPKKSYGRVVESGWNDEMHRIELLVALNGNEKVAAENGGLVADRELEKLASGDEIGVSMGCLVSHDICSYCGNKAPTVSNYCEDVKVGGMCKAGGLRRNMGALVEVDGKVHHLHADNPDPKFFDISHVYKPADRIAYVTGGTEKVAAAVMRKSAELAEQLAVTAPADVLYEIAPAGAAPWVRLAAQADSVEKRAAAGEQDLLILATAFDPALREDLPDPPGKSKFAELLAATQRRKICLPCDVFIQAISGCDREKAAAVAEVVKQHLPGKFQELIESSDFQKMAVKNPYRPQPVPVSSSVEKWANQAASVLSLTPAVIDRQLTRAAIRLIEPTRVPRQKVAATQAAADDLATQYTMYKLAFLRELPREDPDFTLTIAASVLQNYS